ncbi:MAG: hypothetical protein WA705_16815 [Candidatus Ozemobacteraceae bacterium]|jgi:hypothetical protein
MIKIGRYLMTGFVVAILLFPLATAAQQVSEKNQIMDLMTSDSPHDYEKLKPLLLKNPEILENLVFSTEKNSGRYRHAAFSALATCCFHGTISSEKFMDIAIRLIRSIKERSLPEINDMDLAYSAILSQFGYVPPWRFHQLVLKDNSQAFSHCVEKLLQYGLIRNQETARVITKGWAECNKFIVQAVNGREALKASFDNLEAIIHGQSQFLDGDAKTILLGYSKNLSIQALDPKDPEGGSK